MAYINNKPVLLGTTAAHNLAAKPEQQHDVTYTVNGTYVIENSSQPYSKVTVTVATPEETEVGMVEVVKYEDINLQPSEGRAFSEVNVKISIPKEEKEVEINTLGETIVEPSEDALLEKVKVTVDIPIETIEEEITENGEVEFVPTEGYLDKVKLNINVLPELEEVTQEVVENGTVTIEPTPGKAISKVNLTIQVPTSEETLKKIIDKTVTNIPSSLLTGLTSIGDYVFYKSALEKITLPNTITSIGRAAFFSCQNFGRGQTTLIIPASVQSIAEEAFNGCGLIETVRFMGTPEFIAEEIFTNCPNLKTIQVPWSQAADNGRNWGVIAQIVYNYNPS